MLRQICFQEDAPNIDVVFGSCQIFVGLAVALILGWGVGFRVVICSRRC